MENANNNESVEAENLMFFGLFQLHLDAKGRIALPAYIGKKFEPKQELVLTKTYNHHYPVIAVFPNIERHQEGINFYDCMKDFSIDDRRNIWNANTMVFPMDLAKRITLRRHFKEFIPENKEITIFCQGLWFEFWKTDDYNEYKAYLDKKLEEEIKNQKRLTK